MARGIDQSRNPSRNLGPGSSLHSQIKSEADYQRSLFGVLVGTQDDGERTAARVVANTGSEKKRGGDPDVVKTVGRPGPGQPGWQGAPGSRPVFHGAEPNAIKLAQMQENRRSAMAGLLQQPPDNSRPTQGLVDTGMGRLSSGEEFPVHSYIDERIVKKD